MSNSADKPQHPGFEFPAEYAQAIAQITANWAVLESNINLSIWHLAGIYPAIGACITEQIYTLDGRLKALLALLKLRRGPKSLLDKINKFGERVRKAQGIRNQIVHHTWHQSVESKEIKQLEIGAKGTLTYGFKTISLPELQADQETVRLAARLANEIREATEAALPTLPEIPLQELQPIILRSGGSEQTRSTYNTFRLFPPQPFDQLRRDHEKWRKRAGVPSLDDEKKT